MYADNRYYVARKLEKSRRHCVESVRSRFRMCLLPQLHLGCFLGFTDLSKAELEGSVISVRHVANLGFRHTGNFALEKSVQWRDGRGGGPIRAEWRRQSGHGAQGLACTRSVPAEVISRPYQAPSV